MSSVKMLLCYCLPVLIVLILLSSGIHAQTALEIKQANKLFGGAWGNKKTTRHLRIFMEKEGYATINDWTGKYQKRESGDAYKAFIKRGKLVMPEDLEHHAPYSEMQIKNNTLIYLTRFNDLKGKTVIEKELFIREPW